MLLLALPLSLLVLSVASVASVALDGTPGGVSLATDCAIRTEVLRAAAKVLPRRRGYAKMYDALQLGRCNGSSSAPLRPDDASGGWEPPTAPTPQSGLVVYADAEHGSDSAAGTLAAPLQSLEAAVSAVRKHRATSDSVVGQTSVVNATIVLRGGVYYLEQPVTLTAADSWLAITNHATERVEISGGRPLPGLSWTLRQHDPDVDPAAARAGKQWTLFNNTNNVFGEVRAGRDGKDGCKYVATTQTVAGCVQALATSNKRPKGHGWQSFTWQPLTAGAFAGQCYGIASNHWAPHPQRGIMSGRLGPAPPPLPPAPPAPRKRPVAVAKMPANLAGIRRITGLRVNGTRAILARFPNIESTEAQPYASSGPLTGYITAKTDWKPPAQPAHPPTEIVVTKADFPSVEWPMNASDVDPSVPGVPPSETGAGDQGAFTISSGGPCEGDLVPAYGYSCSVNGGPRGAGQHQHPSGLSDLTELPHTPYRNTSTAVVHAWRPSHWFTVQYAVELNEGQEEREGTGLKFSRGATN